MARADLHIHTTASDGVLTPAQVVEEAARVLLSACAISDHDTVAGIPEAIEAGTRLGVQVVPAVELSTDLGPFEIHILGYFIDWNSVKLTKLLEKLRTARMERSRRIVEKLRLQGVPVTFDRVIEIAGSGSVGRPHIAQAIIETGVVDNAAAAFNRYLVRGTPTYVERMKLSPYDAVSMIVDVGGVAGLAHPGQIGRDDIIPALIKVGLGAIEAHFMGQAPDGARHYEELARRFGLIPTGGSDAHGFGEGGGATIGCVTVDARVVERLRDAASSA